MRILLAIGLLFSSSAFATNVNVTFECSPKAYSCGPAGCAWTVFNGQLTTISLSQDLNFPNDVWRARYVTSYDNHHLTLDFTYTSQDRKNPLSVKAYLGTSGVMAESSGSRVVDIALRNNTYGRGFYCNRIRAN